ncbi:hypothetical protein CTAYLR_001168 [Chrysophaeum taylorii]|uniref:Uncharacterized protein n=1 Tax=Chrysophaeum taylorii TaxID=2483200 RepID=A0AAD7UP11_9STRA|nr:hypothetical protein CTAYLR_001168 [Chrysophaeum taylorii]
METKSGRGSDVEAKDEEAQAAHRRTRSLNSITLMRAQQTSGVATRTGIVAEHGPHSPEKKRAELLVSQLVDEARISLHDIVDEAKHSLEELVHRRQGDRTYRRSLRWYGSATNISTQDMVPVAFADTVAIDDAKCALLESSRRLNPVDLVWRFDLALTASIMPRVVRSSVALLVFGAYAATAFMKRFAYLGGRRGDEDDTVVKLSIFVSFIIVFYSNHCYTRFYRQYESVKLCCLLITDAVTMARSLSVVRPRGVFPPAAGGVSLDAVERLFRYLNVAHAAGYVALSPTYTRHNLFEPFVKAHGLLTDAEWRAYFRDLDVEDPTGSAFQEVVLWAMTAVSAARDEFSSPNEMVALQDVVLRFRGSMQSLFDERFQEIPFAYSHLVSFVCAAYLIVLAVVMGLKFGVKEPISSGLVFPALAVFFTTVVLLGLLTLGKAMSQPTGLDPEAFPIFSYLDSTALASRRIIHGPEAARPTTDYAAPVVKPSPRAGTPPAAVGSPAATTPRTLNPVIVASAAGRV